MARILPDLLSHIGEGLSPGMQQIIAGLREEWRTLDDRISGADPAGDEIAPEDAACQTIEIPEFGALSATALEAAIGKGTTFRKG